MYKETCLNEKSKQRRLCKMYDAQLLREMQIKIQPKLRSCSWRSILPSCLGHPMIPIHGGAASFGRQGGEQSSSFAPRSLTYHSTSALQPLQSKPVKYPRRASCGDKPRIQLDDARCDEPNQTSQATDILCSLLATARSRDRFRCWRPRHLTFCKRS